MTNYSKVSIFYLYLVFHILYGCQTSCSIRVLTGMRQRHVEPCCCENTKIATNVQTIPSTTDGQVTDNNPLDKVLTSEFNKEEKQNELQELEDSKLQGFENGMNAVNDQSRIDKEIRANKKAEEIESQIEEHANSLKESEEEEQNVEREDLEKDIHEEEDEEKENESETPLEVEDTDVEHAVSEAEDSLSEEKSMEKKVNEKVESLNHSQQKAASPKEKCLKDAKDKKSIEQETKKLEKAIQHSQQTEDLTGTKTELENTYKVLENVQV